jgi:mannose-6-phosphate isomerase-like protein (cupin superfamily)
MICGDYMNDFSEFMKSNKNLISSKSQSNGVIGWVYDGGDGSQIAYWICERDGVSKEHVHEYDEYYTVVQGKYTVIIDGHSIDVCKGDEYFIPESSMKIKKNFIKVPNKRVP